MGHSWAIQIGQGVTVEARDMLALEEERWKAGRTGEEAMTASRAEHGGSVCSGKCVCARGGVRGARKELGRLAWVCQVASCRACGATRARTRSAWPASAARRPWRGHLARLEARDHLTGDGRAPAREPGPTGVGVRAKVRRPDGNAENTDGATSRPEHTDTQKFFRVALFDWFKQ
jgi:hypothetical protein